ncbi:putative leucine-rich repeat-containing protein DDB G0290503 [Scophthalmus maximus]|uniref:Putative leucine-rich repeat-containing protein DDB G0290503 n=1 Tax=Scophthalmus maximus TaxID=52904 RepID=A0A2U9CH20_SCOMX|nr:putative leucine-rich repeat-containing protein DDB G0290503 [Scophthalmus maximus]KAF0032058.1 hypothetical protein F2P81_016613 [Scophthalmus maximus]
MAGATIPWCDMVEVHDSNVEVLRAELEQAEQDLVCQVKRVSELTTELEMKTKERKFLSDQVEILTSELKKEQSRSLEKSDQMEKLKYSLRQQLLKAKQVNAARVARLHEFVGLQKSNFNLNQKLKIAKNLNRTLEREAARLSTQLESNKIESLSKQEEYLTAELQKEWTWTLEMMDQMEKQNNAHQQDLLEAKQVNAAGEAHLVEKVGELTTKLEMETQKNQSLSEQVEILTAGLQKERTRSLEQSDQMEELKDAHQKQLLEAKQVNAAGEAHLVQRVRELTTELEMETKENKSLSEQVEQLTAELQVEQTRSLEQSDQMEELKDALRQQLLKAIQVNAARVAQLHKFVDLQKSNYDLTQKFRIGKNLNGALEREAARLFTQLEKEIKKIESLSKQEVVKQEYFTAELQKEWTWRLEMIDQLEEQKDAHQQELQALKQGDIEREALRRDLEGLKTANLELVTRLQAEEELSENLKRETTSLSISLEAETLKNKSLLKQGESLTTELQKEQNWRLELGDQAQAERDAHQQELQALCQELEILKATNPETPGKLQAEKEAGNERTKKGRRRSQRPTKTPTSQGVSDVHQ